MRTLLIAAGLFFSIFGGTVLFFAIFGETHEYDLKLVLPIDTRQMPKLVPAPEVVSREIDAGSAIAVGRAESKPLLTTPTRAPVQFGNRVGAASEATGQ